MQEPRINSIRTLSILSRFGPSFFGFGGFLGFWMAWEVVFWCLFGISMVWRRNGGEFTRCGSIDKQCI